MVMSWASPKCRSVNMSMRLDLPTSVSPMMMYLKRCGSLVVVAAILGPLAQWLSGPLAFVLPPLSFLSDGTPRDRCGRVCTLAHRFRTRI